MNRPLRMMAIVVFCSGLLSAQTDVRSLLYASGELVLLRADSVARTPSRTLPLFSVTTVTGTVIMRYDRTQGTFVTGAYEQVSYGVFHSRWTDGPRDIVEAGAMFVLFVDRKNRGWAVEHPASVLLLENYTIADPGHYFSPNDVLSIESFEQLLRKSFF